MYLIIVFYGIDEFVISFNQGTVLLCSISKSRFYKSDIRIVSDAYAVFLQFVCKLESDSFAELLQTIGNG